MNCGRLVLNMRILSVIKSHKIITSASALVIVAAISIPVAAITLQKEPVAKNDKIEVVKADIKPIEKTEVVDNAATAVPVATTPVAESPKPAVTPASPTNSNPYPEGSSLWYVYDRREKVSKAIGAWGGGSGWPSMARSKGIPVDNIPQMNDIAVLGSSVYFVESTDQNTITLSTYRDGTVITNPILKSDEITKRYIFIH